MAGEIASLATPFAAPGGRIIASPFQFATDDDTYLRIVTANSAAGVVLAVNGRRVASDGQLYAINETHTPNTDRSTKTQDFKLGKGALLNLSINDRPTPRVQHITHDEIQKSNRSILALVKRNGWPRMM